MIEKWLEQTTSPSNFMTREWKIWLYPNRKAQFKFWLALLLNRPFHSMQIELGEIPKTFDGSITLESAKELLNNPIPAFSGQSLREAISQPKGPMTMLLSTRAKFYKPAIVGTAYLRFFDPGDAMMLKLKHDHSAPMALTTGMMGDIYKTLFMGGDRHV